MIIRGLSVRLACAVTLAAAALAPTALAATRYVNANLATGANDGTSWANAYRGAGALQTAMTASVSGDQVWVAAGTYLPSTTGVRTAAFTMKTGVAVYGGFAGTEATLEQRNWQTNLTTLSGDLSGNDNGTVANMAENSYHVVVGTGVAVSPAGLMDGFTIVGGYANGATASNQDKGGGIIVANSGAPVMQNCIIKNCRCTFGGGAGYVLAATATFRDCQFLDNNGASFGGAFDTNGGVTRFERCLFRGNTAARAGGIEVFGSGNCTLTNCIFSGNSATGSNGGGAVWISSSTVTARNCTITGNSATQLAGGVRNTGGTSTFGNCIIWNNTGPGGTVVANQISNSGGTTTATYSVVQGTYAGTGNLATDPLFANAAGQDFRLQATSPAIDSGSNALVPAGTTTDYAGLARFVDVPAVVDAGAGTAPIVDRGAHEAPAPPVCVADLDASGVVDGTDLGLLLGSWGATGSADLDASGSIDGTDLGLLLGAWGPCA